MDIKSLLEKYKNEEITQDEVIDKFNESKSDMVPRSRLNDKSEEIESLKNEIAKRDNQINELNESVKGDSELSKQLETLQQANADWESKYKQTQVDTAIKLAVAKEANDANDILNFINRDLLTFGEDGSINGLDEAVNQVKEAKPYLFQQVKPTGRRPQDGEKPGMTKEQFNALSFDEKQELYQQDNTVFEKFK
ncbi:phage scaffolding protein [Mammaliicoccus sciuri]|uniref:phage scaffolding protein n=1 Tax=Mammaliicoccus sciuri TaxID=1296 RepID=UPI0016279407|nr:phage scaffolding protein [Mammaliicoccus sciuri]